MTSNHAAETGRRMPKTLGSACLGFLPVLFVTLFARAQQPPPAPAAEGTSSGNYNIQQSLEVGWRFDDRAGSNSAFNTFVDLHSGPRILAQTLDVHSLNHHGLLFDTLSLSSFGYGGDPNLASRLRVQKNRWYNLNASFRRSNNFWDFDLFANPLNPASSKPSQPVADSPHRFDLARRATDVDLMLAPLSRVRARLGYHRSVQEGPAFDTAHDGARDGVELLLLAPWRTAQDNYQAGVDFKLLPRTNISFDQFVAHIKDERSERDAAFGFRQGSDSLANLT